MKGIELCRQFYEAYGRKMLSEKFANLESRIAVGVCGSGSECFGFDDDISRDHDFEPGFIMFIPDDEKYFDDKTIFSLRKEYENLPMEFMGFTRSHISPVGGNRHGVIKISDFLREKVGNEKGVISDIDFLRIPEESLAEATNGVIFRDDSRVFSNIRLKLQVMPNDIRLKKLAGELLLMAQSGQYNFDRCIKHNEINAAKLAAYEFVRASLHATFLLNEVYMPYYKWQFRALRDLSWPRNFTIKSELGKLPGVIDDTEYRVDFENLLSSIMTVTEDKVFTSTIIKNINTVAKIFIKRLRLDGLIEEKEERKNYLELYAYDVNNHIKDANIRNLHILAGV